VGLEDVFNGHGFRPLVSRWGERVAADYPVPCRSAISRGRIARGSRS
jgi:hypothetical protein